MDIKENKKLLFLDVLVTKKADNILGHQVYRKLTHTDKYLYVKLHHYSSQKQLAICSAAGADTGLGLVGRRIT